MASIRARGPGAALPSGVERGLDAVLDRVLAVQRPVIVAYVDRWREQPGATPTSTARALERRYQAAVSAVGAASGGIAAVPGVGTAAALASGVAEIAAFVEATALFTLATAEVYGIGTEDPDVRRALVLAVLLGEAGMASLEAAGVASAHWAPVLAHGVNRELIGKLNKTLMRHFGTSFGARQGALFLGRALPFGIGIGVGVAGTLSLARAAIKSVRRAFGPPPQLFGPRIAKPLGVES
jgi:hypothetical protein